MEFDNEFTVAAPVEEVWSAILDIERVAPCVPGAKVLEQTGDNAYKVQIRVKLGPMTITYKGDVDVTQASDGSHTATLQAKAREARGQGTANGTATIHLTQEDGVTKANIHTDIAITGKAASMGRGVIGDVSAKLIETFAANLAAMLEPEAPAEPAEAGVSGNGASAEPASAAAPPAAEQPAPTAPQEEASLPIGSIVQSVAAERLKDPKVMAGLLALIALVLIVLGRRRQ